MSIWVGLIGLVAVLFPAVAWSSSGNLPDLTGEWTGFAALTLFLLAYLLVAAEEFTHLKKSKPVVFAAGLMWVLIAVALNAKGFPHAAAVAVRHNILEFSELCLFLLVAMTFINVMDDRNVFESLRSWLVRSGFSLRTLFWLTGLLAFFLSPIADNLTTALFMCAVVMALGREYPAFVSLSCINIVVAANAGGAFSPFGDITTLMVWQKGVVNFWDFFHLFLPSLVNWLVPAAIMSFAVPQITPPASSDSTPIRKGGKRVIILFLITIALAVAFHNYLHLPPMLGMTTGFGLLMFHTYLLKKTHDEDSFDHPVDLFRQVARAEWDTLWFFFGVILCVGGLGTIGFLATTSQLLYGEWGATAANITIGILSAMVDNIPVMFAVLTMNPDMSLGQWLLVTLTAGVGG
ncbi:MAG: sodium:proton antiporter NhaD, partial [Magnetococcales bacterium]|nr:sodium:proton antiporter NhaD [Magnetococcales bacterium]